MIKIYNRFDIQKDIKADDGEVYFIPPRAVVEIPSTISNLGDDLVEVISEGSIACDKEILKTE